MFKGNMLYIFRKETFWRLFETFWRHFETICPNITPLDSDRGVFRTLSNIKDGGVCKNSQWLKAPSQMFDRVLNTPLWMEMFHKEDRRL